MRAGKELTVLWVLGICLLPAARLSAAEQAGKAGPPNEYQKLVAQVKGLSEKELAKFDFGKLRKAFFETGEPDLLRFYELRDSTYKAADERRDQEVVNAAARVLDVDYTDARAHLYKAVAHKNLGQQKQYLFHLAVSDGLLQSILKTGDGKSFGTAWHVYQVKEEHNLLCLELDVPKLPSQTLINHEGRMYDVLKAQTKEGQTREFYFDVTEHMKGLERPPSGKGE
jgi:hypothetical protein